MHRPLNRTDSLHGCRVSSQALCGTTLVRVCVLSEVIPMSCSHAAVTTASDSSACSSAAEMADA